MTTVEKYSDWSSSFDKRGHVQCSSTVGVISGFYRRPRLAWGNDPTSSLEKAMCCYPPNPWVDFPRQIVYANWQFILDNNNMWANCPPGFFLQGFYRSDGQGLSNIEFGRCYKPAGHPTYYGQCYEDTNIQNCFDDEGLCTCKDGYFITGLYRSDCNQLYCINKMKCCKMAAEPAKIDETYKIKELVMDKTMNSMGQLASYLGYGWCQSCIAPYDGEDFRRNGYTWVADRSGTCEGFKNDQRLSMVYGDWSFGIKEIKYGNPVIEDLKPESIDSGTIYNNDATKATKAITRTETIVRSVTHTTTSEFKNSKELGLEISYTPPPIGGMGATASFKFAYETTTSTTDENNNEQSQSFSVSTSKEMAPYSAVKWSLILSKTRTTVPYTAVIIARFSCELRGFLRWGEGPSGKYTNYHQQYRGSGDRPTVNYKFGDATTPFYDALKRQSTPNAYPWLWNDIKSVYPNSEYVIDELCDENNYVFKLTGKFEDVVGKHVEVRWDTVPNGISLYTGSKSASLVSKLGIYTGIRPVGTTQQVGPKSGTAVAKSGSDDPQVNPAPPEYDIEVDNLQVERSDSSSNV
ncbi:uncharacterized protein LOC131944339 [Physella acuta]|uniref:uncharacterized protein LOC131944339 n=1 Tax=Physella acuta TaxID=109671 RepID=UPI0027DDC02E|nr:uncharacterized protein LOC131944339 [Physella acuta]